MNIWKVKYIHAPWRLSLLSVPKIVIQLLLVHCMLLLTLRKRELVALNRGSNLSAHVLLNLLNELGKRDKM